MVQALLERAGHTVTLCRSGASAVAEARSGRPDLLIIDSRLADLSPLQVCAALTEIPIIVCGPVDVAIQRMSEVADARVIRAVLIPASIKSAIGAALEGTAPRPASSFPEQAVPSEMRALLVEDDDSIAAPLVEGLARYGIVAARVTTGAQALAAPPADLVLLDLGLPDIDGLDVFRRLRRTSGVPVIMLTARGAEADRVRGLDLGADDYLAKPFSLRELVARIHAVGRRTWPSAAAAPR